jgi:predicted RNA-binding protein associated with RNAse of E/G family
MQDWIWQKSRFLIVKKPGKYFSTYLMWHDVSDQFRGWYVNFERPFTRAPIGVDTLDLELDLIINPDHTWHWKDKEEFEEGVRRGVISKNTAWQVELAKEEVLRRLATRTFPFDGSWIDWQPDDAWGIPTLPPDWRLVT